METFEGWNGIFQACSILSNHHSPSCDIAETLAGMERVKHIVSGGWWKLENGTHVQVGNGIITYFQSDQQLRRHLGLSSTLSQPLAGLFFIFLVLFLEVLTRSTLQELSKRCQRKLKNAPSLLSILTSCKAKWFSILTDL
jgi:hypothetical protein